MKETKQAPAGSPEARLLVGEMLAAFEAFKDANDQRLAAIERRAADGLLEEKVARIDQAVSQAQARLERIGAEARRPMLGDPSTASRSPSPFHGEETFASAS